MFNSQFEGPKESPGFLLWQLSTAWRRTVEKVLLPLDLTHPQFVLLASVGWLTKDGGKITQKDLSDHCKMDITQTSQVLRNLEKKGWITRKVLRGDERAKYPFLTKKGEKLLDKALPLVESADHTFFKPLGKEKEAAFLDILRINLAKKESI